MERCPARLDLPNRRDAPCCLPAGHDEPGRLPGVPLEHLTAAQLVDLRQRQRNRKNRKENERRHRRRTEALAAIRAAQAEDTARRMAEAAARRSARPAQVPGP